MKIKLIADGWKEEERKIERWGISFLLGEDILFDTFGDEKIFFSNIEKFKIDISKVKKIIISHDHWDHIAGLWRIIDRNKNVDVYICKNSREEFKKKIYSYGVGVIEIEKVQKIEENIYTTGQMRCFSDKEELFEQSIVIKGKEGITILTGCSHPGINIVADYVKEKFGKKIFMVAGGFHLRHKNKEEIEKIASYLRSSGVEMVIPLHCTGERGKEIFKEIFKTQFISLKEGDELNVNV